MNIKEFSQIMATQKNSVNFFCLEIVEVSCKKMGIYVKYNNYAGNSNLSNLETLT